MLADSEDCDSEVPEDCGWNESDEASDVPDDSDDSEVSDEPDDADDSDDADEPDDADDVTLL